MKNQVQFSFRGVRSSKFRHIFGSPARRDRCYDSLKITRNAHDGNFCAANPKFVAVVTEVAGGGAFVVIPLERTGRVDASVGRVTGHAGPVMDIKWNPFNDNVIASGSDDSTVKVWHVPDGGLSGSLTEWLVDLRGHKRRVSYIDWHPTAENVLISAGLDHLIIVWNISQGSVINAIDCHPEVIFSMSLNRDGSLLATTCKDKKLRIIEPRSGRVLQEGQCHEGAKACKVQYLGDSGRLLTTGFSKFSDRQYAVWDERRLDEPLRRENIDSSSGILYPFYDPDTRVLFLAGKGDGNIRYYEIVDESPWCHYLNQYISGSPQRGLGVLTKRAVDTRRCEIYRFFKLHATKDICEPLSMIVPRKSDQFQEDIYPDTAAPTPAMTAEEWIAGHNKPPVLMSLRTVGVLPGVAVRTNKPASVNRTQDGIQTGDRNTDRKFAFISTASRPDYRPQQVSREPAARDKNNKTNKENVSPRPKSSRSSSSAALSHRPRLSKSVSERDLSRWSSDLATSEKSGKIKEIIELLERQARAQILRASDARREPADDSGVVSADSSDEPGDTADDDTDPDESTPPERERHDPIEKTRPERNEKARHERDQKARPERDEMTPPERDERSQQPDRARPTPRPRQERLNEANKATSKFQQIQQMWTEQEPSSPAPQSPGPDSGHKSMPLKPVNGVCDQKEPRRASFGSGGAPQPTAAPAVRQEQQQQRSAPVNGARELPHKAELELRKRYAEQAEEIKQLKNMLNIKEQRIRELEDQLDNVLKTQNESVA
ncbi:Coronin-2B [Amphibalanus amphitrite]|uniref:Coronin n=1 Tax=Amphibalanus amphitrite TaxID=1232801 RepID=A0A6A4VPP0_AMPAM|nr:Coronin-2B [Amphibalanus amphitrite]